MNEFKLGGSVTSALTHFMMYGLAAILEDAGHRPVRFWWTDEAEPVPMFSVDLSWGEVAEKVKRHAESQLDAGSWMMAEATGFKKARALFSPRAQAPADEQWLAFMDQRYEAFPANLLAGRFVHALGQPAWWHAEKGTPDSGASRWEMKTRNRGEEFISGRLVHLAEAVANRDAQQVADGLAGLSRIDEAGRNSDTSRTPTGLAVPGPTDNAAAWCALWGMTVAPPIPVIGQVSDTPGVWRRRRTHPEVAALPVWAKPVSVRVVRSTLTSAVLDEVAFSPESASATDTLGARGVAALVQFPIHKGGSASAPERFLLTGHLVPCGGR